MTLYQASKKQPLVVIAHQSAIPHYRVKFYQKLKELAKGRYEFSVLFDPHQSRGGEFTEEVDPAEFGFQILPARLHSWRLGGRNLRWQSAGSKMRNASLLVTDTHLSNLAYPWTALTRRKGCRWALWGHVTNQNQSDEQRAKIINRFSAAIKSRYVARADAFIAYTEQQKAKAIAAGLTPERVFVVNNTIDLDLQRRIAVEQRPQRDEIRSALGFGPDEFIIVTVGRLLPGRRIDFLLEAFQRMAEVQPLARLIVIGSGNLNGILSCEGARVEMVGSVTEPAHLGRYLTAADAYVAPGMIGLGILQPLAHELPLVGFALETHGPEVDYLNASNSILLPRDTTSDGLALFLAQMIQLRQRWDARRYKSVAHLTLDNMAFSFDHAVWKTLQ